jgi:hypothetical protein
MGKNVSPFPAEAGRLPRALSQALKRREHLQYDQSKVPRSCAEQNASTITESPEPTPVRKALPRASTKPRPRFLRKTAAKIDSDLHVCVTFEPYRAKSPLTTVRRKPMAQANLGRLLYLEGLGESAKPGCSPKME